MDKKRKRFLETESLPDVDAVDIVEWQERVKDITISLADKARVEFGAINTNFERNFTLGKGCSNNIAAYSEIFPESQPMGRNVTVEF